MTINEELNSKFDEFYNLPKDEQDIFLNTILKMANSEPEKFIQAVHNEEFGEHIFNKIPILYEALSGDLDNWADFFLNEVKRLFKLAVNYEKPRWVLDYLMALTFIDSDKFKHRKEVTELLIGELTNPHPAFRYYALDILPDFMDENDRDIINKIKQHLKDPNWKIRYNAYMILKDLKQLKQTDKLGWLDKFKADNLTLFLGPTYQV